MNLILAERQYVGRINRFDVRHIQQWPVDHVQQIFLCASAIMTIFFKVLLFNMDFFALCLLVYLHLLRRKSLNVLNSNIFFSNDHIM